MNNTDMLILFLVTLCATIFFTWYVKRIFLRARIADNPIVSEHRHKSGTPTMGGVAFLFAISFVIAAYYQNIPILLVSFIMLAGAAAAFVVSIILRSVAKLDNTSAAAYTVGTIFSATTLITAGYYGLFGSWLAIDGDGSSLLMAISSGVVAAMTLTAAGRGIRRHRGSVPLSTIRATTALRLTGAEATMPLMLQRPDPTRARR